MANVRLTALVNGEEKTVEMTAQMLYTAWFVYERDRRRELVHGAIGDVLEEDDGYVKKSMMHEIYDEDSIDDICDKFDERMDCDDFQEEAAREIVRDFIEWNDGYKEDEDEDDDDDAEGDNE